MLDRGAPRPEGWDEARTKGGVGECLELQATGRELAELSSPSPGGCNGQDGQRQLGSSRRLLSQSQGPVASHRAGQHKAGPRWGFRTQIRRILRFLVPPPPHPPSGSVRSIDTCAGPAPAANIFLMSSQGLKPVRSALQGGFSPGRCFGKRRCFEARGPGWGWQARTNLSLRGARAEDFLLKFKTGAFSRAPKMYFSADNGLLFS